MSEHNRLANDYQYCIQLLKDNCGDDWLNVKRYLMEDIDPYNMKSPNDVTKQFIAKVWELCGPKNTNNI